jgi:hypothetical protein
MSSRRGVTPWHQCGGASGAVSSTAGAMFVSKVGLVPLHQSLESVACHSGEASVCARLAVRGRVFFVR